MTRPLEDLQRHQLTILAAYRVDREPRPAVPAWGSSPGGSEIAYGRVVDIVDADPVYGPHLLVMRQAWQGTPPAAADAGVAPIRCYPAPMSTVRSFGTDELVRVFAIDGAMIVEAL